VLKTNEKKLVEQLLQCQPGFPPGRKGFSIDLHGKPFELPSIGGITINVQAGDSAFGWEGDHIEPGVSCQSGNKPMENPNRGLQVFSCAGNKATISSGKAKGKKGIVLGHHGGSEHVIIDFDRKTKEQLTYDDKIMIRSVGLGLKLIDYPTIHCYNLSPSLLKKMKIQEIGGKNKRIKVPVTTLVPSECMGSGIGHMQPNSGDYDIMTSDPVTNEKYKFNKIRFGDFVALLDQDNRYGRTHKTGAITIGIVVHSDCLLAGHGPGVMTLLTSVEGDIEPVIDPGACIADLLSIGNKRKQGK